MLGVVAALLAGQTWRVIDAIERVQDAVVPLPTREGRPRSALVRSTPEAVRSTAVPPLSVGAARSVATVPAITDDDGRPSALDVAGQVLGAGFDRGDPGRATAWGGRTELNVLVLGVDRRPGGGDQNADVVILARVDLARKRLRAVSIPRDLLVDIPDIGADRINSAYNYGVLSAAGDPAAGVALVRDTVEAAFGVPIDGYVLVDFAGFETVIDAVGGVQLDVPAPIHDPAYPRPDYGTEVVDFAAGRQWMNGERALQYARTRNADSDDGRRDRQLQVLVALFERGKSLGSVARADEVIVALGDAVQTGFDLRQQLLLVRVAFATDRADIEMITLAEPLIEPATTDAGAWVYIGDPTALAAFVQAALATGPIVAP